MKRWQRPPPHRNSEIISIEGEPTETDRRVISEVVEHIVWTELQARLPSTWLRAGRASGRRLGMYDYRDRFSPEEAWRWSLHLPPGGREYVGLWGRGDAK